MSNTLDLIEEKPLISIQELSQKLSVSIRTIRRWNSEAQKMGGFTKNGFPRCFIYVYGTKAPRWLTSSINEWIKTLNKEKNMQGEVIHEISSSWNFDIKDDCLLSITDICEKLDITKPRLKKLRMGLEYYGGRKFVEPICYLQNGLSPHWSAKMVHLWLDSNYKYQVFKRHNTGVIN